MAEIKLNNVTAISETGGVATFGTPSSTLKYPAGHVIGTALLQNRLATNTATPTFAAYNAATYHIIPITEELYYHNVGVTLSSNQFTLPAGSYIIKAMQTMWFTDAFKMQLHDGSNYIHDSTSGYVGSSVTAFVPCELICKITPSSSTTYELRMWYGAGTVAPGQKANSANSNYEVYLNVTIDKIQT